MAIAGGKPRKFHGRNLRHGRWSECGRIYLVTTVTRNRVALFSEWPCAVACARALHDAPSAGYIEPLAWVVMPDHIHWLFSLKHGTLAGMMRGFKSASSRAINEAAAREGPVWQRGYHDHAVRQEEDVRALARYVVANPVRAGLCTKAGDYPFWDAAWL